MTLRSAEQVKAAAGLLRQAESVLFITGAGVSADSGLPTYRGVGGLYETTDPPEGIPIEVLLSGPMMDRHPELTWKYICQIEAAARGAQPNPAHEIIAKLQTVVERVTVLTQNVDGFHGRAGSTDVIEVHGTLRRLRCVGCPWTQQEPDYATLASQLGSPQEPRAPSCPDCGAVVRPDVVLFGEMLPSQAVMALQRAEARGFDVVVSVGTSSAFPYIAQPVITAARLGAATVEINPNRTEISDIVDVRIEDRARPVFEALWRQIEGN